jgi:hypothetical protein
VEQHLLFVWRGWWQIPRALGLAYALFMFLEGARVYDMRDFLGIRKAIFALADKGYRCFFPGFLFSDNCFGNFKGDCHQILNTLCLTR